MDKPKKESERKTRKTVEPVDSEGKKKEWMAYTSPESGSSKSNINRAGETIRERDEGRRSTLAVPVTTRFVHSSSGISPIL